MEKNKSSTPTRAILLTIVLVVVCVALVCAALVFSGLVTIGHSQQVPAHSVRQVPPVSLTHHSQSLSSAEFVKCESDVTTQAQAAAGSIATNTILVVFATTTNYQQAQTILGLVGASSTMAVNPTVFARNRLLQAFVPATKKIFDICTLRATSTVQYAGFDQLFFLHP